MTKGLSKKVQYEEVGVNHKGVKMLEIDKKSKGY
jgi:hypothetical protein